MLQKVTQGFGLGTVSLKKHRQWKMDRRFGTWNISSPYRSGSLTDRQEEGGMEPADSYTMFYGNENDNHHLGTGFFIYKRVEFLSDMMYIILCSHL
jgi:hypothetical protein